MNFTQMSLDNFDEPEKEEIYLLMSLQEQYYDEIRRGEKKYEYRRSFLKTPSSAYIYLTSPRKQIAGLVIFDTPFIGTVEEISEIYELQKPGSKQIMRDYLRGCTKAYAVPILSLTEFKPVSLSELKSYFPSLVPPQTYIYLNKRPELLSFLKERCV